MTSQVIGRAHSQRYHGFMSTTVPNSIGTLLREWRERRRMTQLDLALEAEVSTRHISFMETGRARPSPEMIRLLAEHLNIPLRERNILFLAAGFAPEHPARKLDSPDLEAARHAVDLILAAHEPNPAIAIDRHWNLVAGNRMLAPFFEGVAPHLQQPPVNVLRATLHPEGVAPRIANLAQWRTHLLTRLRRQIDLTADPVLAALHDEIVTYPEGNPHPSRTDDREVTNFVVPLRLHTSTGVLSFLYTTTVFGTPLDVTLDELAIETFFPADSFTVDAFRTLTPAG